MAAARKSDSKPKTAKKVDTSTRIKEAPLGVLVVPVDLESRTLDTAPTAVSAKVPLQVMILAGRAIPVAPTPTKDKIGWSESRRRYVMNYLMKLQMIMRLADWEITVVFDTSADCDTVAAITPILGQRRASLTFGKEFFLCSPADQKQTLVHELCHLYLANLEDMATEALEAATDARTMKVFDAAFRCEAERVVDAMADVIAPLLVTFELPSR